MAPVRTPGWGRACHSRHTFPLDGEYVFKLTLKRDLNSRVIEGLEEDEHEIELRVDHALLRRFMVGGKFKGLSDPGTLAAPLADDLEGQRVHEYRMFAD